MVSYKNMDIQRGVRFRFLHSYLFRSVLVTSIVLLGIVGSVHIAAWRQLTEEEMRGTITITARHAESPDTPPMDHGSRAKLAAVTHYDEGAWDEKEFTVQEDMWFTEFSTDFTGSSVHNFYLFVKDSHDTWCPENPTAIYSGGTVSATRPVTFEPPYGVFVKKGTTLVLKSMHHATENGTAESEDTFSVHARYEPAAYSTRSVPVSLHFITPGPCEYTRPVFTVPARTHDVAYSNTQKPFVFTEDGVILKAMAHFHASYDAGLANTVRLLLNDKELDSFTTTNIGDGAERNPRLLAGTLVKIRSGDILTMQAIFSNPSAVNVPEGMAIIGFYFAPQK